MHKNKSLLYNNAEANECNSLAKIKVFELLTSLRYLHQQEETDQFADVALVKAVKHKRFFADDGILINCLDYKKKPQTHQSNDSEKKFECIRQRPSIFKKSQLSAYVSKAAITSVYSTHLRGQGLHLEKNVNEKLVYNHK